MRLNIFNRSHLTSLAVVAAATLWVAPIAVAQNMSHEEQIVRTAYAKLSYATQLGAMHKVLLGKNQLDRRAIEKLLKDEVIHFELSDISSGPISEISQRKYTDLTTKPTGLKVLDVGTESLTYTRDISPESIGVNVSETFASATWAPGPDLSNQNWDIPAADALTLTGVARGYSRYAALKVAVSFQGTTRHYNALFLFGTGEIDHDKEGVLAIDSVTGNSALSYFANNAVYPAVLLETNIGKKHPEITDWLVSQQVADSSCQAGKHQVCCDPRSLKCGVAADDLRPLLATGKAKHL